MDATGSASERELDALRIEQIERIKNRDSFINFNIIALAVLLAAAFSEVDRPVLLLLVPFVNLAFGWTFLVNDIKIGTIAAYLRSVGRTDEWEAYQEGHRGGWILKPSVSVWVQLLIFVAPSFLAVGAYMDILVESDKLSGITLLMCMVAVVPACFMAAALFEGKRRRTGRKG